MSDKISLKISENGRTLDFVSKETLTSPESLLETLITFKNCANETLSKLILSREDNDSHGDHDEDNQESDESSSEESGKSPKKRKI